MHPILWCPQPTEFPPTLQYLCNRKIHKNRERLSDHVKLLPTFLRQNIDEFNQKKIEIKNKLEQMQKMIDTNDDFFSALMIYKKRGLLCSIKLSKVYKELYTKFQSGELTGVILPSPDDDIIKSLLYTADGTTSSFRISVEKSRNLYSKYGINAISVTVPQDATGNQDCCLDDLPKEIEIALVDNTSNALTYIHPMCCDVLRFITTDELVISINELVNYDRIFIPFNELPISINELVIYESE